MHETVAEDTVNEHCLVTLLNDSGYLKIWDTSDVMNQETKNNHFIAILFETTGNYYIHCCWIRLFAQLCAQLS